MQVDDDLDLGSRNQFLAPDLVLIKMARVGAERACRRSVVEVVVLSMMAGAFITVGALFSTLIAAGTSNEGLQRLLEGVGFSAGFFIVVLSGALLFTEVNVEMPATLLQGDTRTIAGRVGRLWILAAVGNLAGAFLTGLAIHVAQSYSPAFDALLGEIVTAKMRYREIGGLDGWGRAVLSGALGNWLVGMAAFLAVMGRTIIGKYVPILLTVSAFVAAGFMHSPANMAYFSLATPDGIGPGWGPALAWSIAPAAIGNVLGAFFLVALPFWLVNTQRAARRPDTGDALPSASSGDDEREPAGAAGI
jgi:formate transporter